MAVHPGGGDASSWDHVTRLLTGDFRVVRPQRRIYAPDADLTVPHSMATETDGILAVARLLPGPVLLAGHSSGAVAALEAAVREPSAFTGLHLYEPPLPTRTPVGGEAGLRARQALDAGDPVEAIRIHLLDIVHLEPRTVDNVLGDPAARAAITRYAAAQLTDNDAIDALGTGVDRFRDLDLPVTLAMGDLSPSHLRKRTAHLASALPRAHVVTLAGQGHLAHLTAPAALAATIRTAAHHGTRRAERGALNGIR